MTNIHTSDDLQRSAAWKMQLAVDRTRNEQSQAAYRQNFAQNKVAGTMQRVRYGAQEKADAYMEARR